MGDGRWVGAGPDPKLGPNPHLRGRDGDGVAGVHAHGVHVLDGADDDHVVGQVAHDLQLKLLPAQQAALDQHLRAARGRPLACLARTPDARHWLCCWLAPAPRAASRSAVWYLLASPRLRGLSCCVALFASTLRKPRSAARHYLASCGGEVQPPGIWQTCGASTCGVLSCCIGHCDTMPAAGKCVCTAAGQRRRCRRARQVRCCLGGRDRTAASPAP